NSDLSLSPQGSGLAAPNGVVIVPPVLQSTTPTPATPVYQVGVWVSDNTPSGGAVTVFVRVVQDMQGAPGIPVSVLVQSPGFTKKYGPTPTDNNGIPSFAVRFGAASPTAPVFVTASARVSGEALSAQTTFVPVGGSSQSGSSQQDGSGSPPPDGSQHRHH